LTVVDGNLHVNSEAGEFLGIVEARHGQRLARLMTGGNEYSASVTSLSDESLSIIIREIYQHPNQVGQISFPSKGLGSARQFDGDKLARRFTEYDEAISEEPSYNPLSEEDEVEPEIIDEGEEEETQQ
ncbi:MAG: hypothetical protein FWC25_01785, partial [Dehalococcoidia bacterium]|nr:hypothetical protein [Dehalococcoidia bacterium]